MDAPSPQSFEEFWPYYVSQHLDPTCRALHFAGTSLAMACVAVSPLVPAALLAAPVCGYGFAWIGHFAWSLRGDLRMWRRMVTGQMAEEVARVRAAAATDVAAAAA